LRGPNRARRPRASPKDCIMRRGDMLLLSAYTPHRSQFNRSDGVRWSMDLRFQRVGGTLAIRGCHRPSRSCCLGSYHRNWVRNDSGITPDKDG
jgi:hypothetical protein